MRTHLAGYLLAVGLLGFSQCNVNASTIYPLNLSNGAIGLGPWGAVTVSLIDSTHAVIEFDAAAGVMFAAPNGVGANVGGSFTLGAITATNSILGATPTWVSGGNDNTFGSFTVRAEDNSAYNNSATKVVVNITDTGTPWASSLAVLTLNNYPAYVTAHIGVCNTNPCSATEGSFTTTGFAAGNALINTTLSEVPLPATFPLFATGIGVLGLLGWRRTRKSAAGLASA